MYTLTCFFVQSGYRLAAFMTKSGSLMSESCQMRCHAAADGYSEVCQYRTSLVWGERKNYDSIIHTEAYASHDGEGLPT
jgi:hypothetical protein